MTYAKISVPLQPLSEKPASQKIPEKNTTENHSHPHRPEIVITENKKAHYHDYHQSVPHEKSGFLPSLGTVICVAALCLCSFILGCSVTGSSLSSAIIGISTVASGRFADTEENSNNSQEEEVSVYQKYMQEPSGEIEYLAANPYLPVDTGSFESIAEQNTQTEIAVENIDTSRVGADGEILYPVVSKNLATDNIHALNNQTNFLPDTYKLLSKTPLALQNINLSETEPTVLIVHTHATESYNMCNADGYYSTNLSTRSENTDENVVGIGAKIAEILENYGIGTIHCTKLCDKDSFVYAYSTSAETVKEYLEKYPSIKLVIDLHRDSIEASDRSKTKPVFEYADRKTAQLMFVVGTNAAGANHPNWQENLSLALHLQSEISKDYPELFRKINLRTASFNQQLSPGYLLLECGSCANTQQEAQNAAEIFATGLARVIKQ